jgi:hypothetical protein
LEEHTESIFKLEVSQFEEAADYEGGAKETCNGE